jgi:hypothetical protein
LRGLSTKEFSKAVLEQIAQDKQEEKLSNAMLAALESQPTPEPEGATYQDLPTFKADLQLFDIIRDLVSAHKKLQDPKVQVYTALTNM